MDKKFEFAPNLALGQHFIANDAMISKMTKFVGRNSVVIEIGPGFGKLTEALSLKAKKIYAVEIDKRFTRNLNQIVKKHNNIKLIFGDATTNILDKIPEINNKNVIIVSNLPYHITEPIITKMVKYRNLNLVLMVGKKFGLQAQVEDPENPNYNELSFICQSFYKIEKIADVPRVSFLPVPNTDSIILKLTPKEIDPKDNLYDYIVQNLVLAQKYGGQIKNILMKIFILASDKTLTKNQAREKVEKLNLKNEILSKSFAQLNNKEIQSLATELKRIK